ncbi:MAG: hypothetical protein ACT4NX_07520 [Deltaproteobacteria bacterium]
MVSREGLLMGVVWVVFMLILGFMTAHYLGASATPASAGFKLIFLGILLAAWTIESKLSKDEPADYDGLTTQSYLSVLNFGVILSLAISIIFDIWQSGSVNPDNSCSVTFFATSIYLVLFLLLRSLHGAILNKKVI